MSTRFAGEKLVWHNPFHWIPKTQGIVDNAMDRARANPDQQLLGGSGMHGNNERIKRIIEGY